jgi:hypothetical protein
LSHSRPHLLDFYPALKDPNEDHSVTVGRIHQHVHADSPAVLTDDVLRPGASATRAWQLEDDGYVLPRLRPAVVAPPLRKRLRRSPGLSFDDSRRNVRAPAPISPAEGRR